ncbi:protein phosphatase [Niveomyces insectorum RCEF 264]|uniref:Protein phosphatase n=1 Tax=Niveomyces insectorum RCEF 264 TaxID=1081102 RepID=A0A168A1Z7_9HYPO|nr:protein phosphatase [Niveomyces insectorum RCEF 264]
MDIKLTVENVQALSAGTSTLGTLKLTNYHIIFCAPVPVSAHPPPPPPPVPPKNQPPHSDTREQSQHHRPPAVRQRESWITYPIISYCTYRPCPSSSGVPSSIRLRCRDFNFVCFHFHDDKQAREVFEFIRNRTCRLGSIEKLYAFFYTPARQEKDFCGWDLYDAKAEFRRQGISEKLPDKGWRISTINKDYAFSPTYPGLLVVPSKISDNVLKYAGQFRSRARVPALTYYHPITQCSITRSSQPLVGVRNNRSIQDERLVSACFYKSTDVFDSSKDLPGSGTLTPTTAGADTEASSLEGNSAEFDALSETERFEDDFVAAATDEAYDGKPGSRIVGARRDNLIVDARPAINSLAMQVVGKGSENMDHYKSATKMFLSIDNIHVMRDSLNKVIEAVKDADVSPFPPNQDLLSKSGWLKHIRGVLTGAQTIARQVGVRAAHVLIHCSDGWDRTSQLSALAQIMLDPYFRTIDGFIILVEKDWLSFGHMFQQRSGYLNHEKWFVTQYDAMAGTKIDPSENDGRNEVFDNAVASAKRFFKKSLSQEKDESDGDSLAPGDDGNGNGSGYKSAATAAAAATSATLPIEESQATRPREISPVFHQFLDATYQLLRQHPTRFEFNERFLRRLLYHLYSCQYGTFLYNNERQRRDAKVREKTSSVWDYFLSRRQEFLNPKYDAQIDSSDRQEERLIFPRLHEIRWWHQAFNRTDEDMNAALNAAAAAAERSATYHATIAPAAATIVVAPEEDGLGTTSFASSHSASPRRGASPVPPVPPAPPSLQTSQSASGELETAAPSASVARLMLAMPTDTTTASLNRSTSASEPSAFATLRDGIAGLGLGQKMGGVLGSFTGVGAVSSNNSNGHSNSNNNSNDGTSNSNNTTSNNNNSNGSSSSGGDRQSGIAQLDGAVAKGTSVHGAFSHHHPPVCDATSFGGRAVSEDANVALRLMPTGQAHTSGDSVETALYDAAAKAGHKLPDKEEGNDDDDDDDKFSILQNSHYGLRVPGQLFDDSNNPTN